MLTTTTTSTTAAAVAATAIIHQPTPAEVNARKRERVHEDTRRTNTRARARVAHKNVFIRGFLTLYKIIFLLSTHSQRSDGRMLSFHPIGRHSVWRYLPLTRPVCHFGSFVWQSGSEQRRRQRRHQTNPNSYLTRIRRIACTVGASKNRSHTHTQQGQHAVTRRNSRSISPPCHVHHCRPDGRTVRMTLDARRLCVSVRASLFTHWHLRTRPTQSQSTVGVYVLPRMQTCIYTYRYYMETFHVFFPALSFIIISFRLLVLWAHSQQRRRPNERTTRREMLWAQLSRAFNRTNNIFFHSVLPCPLSRNQKTLDFFPLHNANKCWSVLLLL